MTELELDGGGSARVLSSRGDAASLLSSRPFPPGATLTGRATASLPEYRLKVRGSKLQPEQEPPRYLVSGRWVSLTRAQREHLEAHAAPER